MSRHDSDWFELTDAFVSAALGVERWQPALERLATFTGSRAGQLIGFTPDGTLTFNLFSGLDPGIHEDYVAAERTLPAVNPRVRASQNARLLHAVAEADFISPHEHVNDPHYRDFARPWGIPYSCIAPVSRGPDTHVVLAVFRSEAQGHIDAGARAEFQTLAGHVRGAVRMQRALGEQGALVAAGMLESLSLAAFVCDRDGRVHAQTPAADAIATSGDFMTVRNQMLRAASPDGAALSAAIRHAGEFQGRPGPPPGGALLVHGRRDPSRAIALDIFRLPGGALEFSDSPRVLVVARGARRRRGDLGPLLQVACGLTEAEADVALALSDGMALDEVAAARGVGVATVRSQVKSVFAKLGVRRQAELAARLHALR